MQIETLTITTETTPINNGKFKVTTFELTVTGFCDICGKRESGTKESLKREGWHFGCGFESCPNCND